MIWPPIKYSYRTINKNPPTPAPSAPTHENLLGTDNQARDYLAASFPGHFHIETDEEAAACDALGFQALQGFLFGRPSPITELNDTQ